MPEGPVAGPGPHTRVVVEGRRTADLVDPGEAVLEGLRGVVEELRLVGRAGRTTLGAGAVVGDHHDDGVVQVSARTEEVQQSPEVVAGGAEEAGEDLHHSTEQPA